MFSFRLSGKRRGGVFAVADIASGSAGVAIIETRPHGPARMLAAHRSALSLEERSPEATISGVLAELEKAAQKSLEQYSAHTEKAQSHVSAAYAIIRAPWSHSRAIRKSRAFETEIKVEESLIAELAQEALKEAGEAHTSEVFETSVVRVQLNGYPTAHPVAKSAHHAEVAVLVSDCDPKIRSGVSEILSKIFACPPPTLRSGTRALLTVLRENTLLPKECFVVNMTSHGTSFVAVRKGIVAETITIPEGSRSIIGRVASGKMPEETLSLLRLVALDQCENTACESVLQALAQAEPALVKTFGEAMMKVSSARRLPNTLVLSAHEDLAPWLAHFLSKIDFSQFTMTTRPFSVRVLTKDDLSGIVAPVAPAQPDIGLIVASALVNIEKQADS